ncbi:MAG: NAD(P)-dependent oxidoreductase, partial [Bacteroidota bacterium]
VATLATAFDMQVVYHSSKQADTPWHFVELDTLFAKADIISLHIPLTPKTTSIIDEVALQKMQPHTLIVNTARGGIIDQEALTQALLNNQIGGYATDVLAKQPPAPNDPLIGLPNVLITPHAASLTVKTYSEICMRSVQNMLTLLRGEEIDSHFIFNR